MKKMNGEKKKKNSMKKLSKSAGNLKVSKSKLAAEYTDINLKFKI